MQMQTQTQRAVLELFWMELTWDYGVGKRHGPALSTCLTCLTSSHLPDAAILILTRQEDKYPGEKDVHT